MRQIVQDLKNGQTQLWETPAPRPGHGEVLIRSRCSLVSLGTERMLVEFGKAGLIEKARQQPDKVRQVIEKAKTDGIWPTVDAVRRKLDSPMPLGYSNCGEVMDIGSDVHEFNIGDRVVSNGPHAEIVCVPKNLCAKVPDGVHDEAAAFTVVGAIGLQGIRLASPSFGETIVVFGLGLVGLLTCQLLRANGCRVVGVDLNEAKLSMASPYGVETCNAAQSDPVEAVGELTSGVGADAVIITASAKSNAVISQAARMSRKRGRIVLVGVVGLQLDRAEFYAKELTFQVSCSYGAGRYDPLYEQKGIDYPLPYVRWTEKRNFEAVLHSLATGQLSTDKLISQRVAFEKCVRVYEQLGKRENIGIVLTYSREEEELPRRSVSASASIEAQEDVKGIAVIGAGDFTKAVALPSLKKANASIHTIVSSKGLSARHLAQKYSIPVTATDISEALHDNNVGGVIITTRHNLHAQMGADALEAGKRVFVEKPLAIDENGLQLLLEAAAKSRGHVVVGYNRRFSPYVRRIRKLLGPEPGFVSISATMNAGAIPPDSWVHDPGVGGGRLVGEACHLVDLISFIAGSPVAAVTAQAMGLTPGKTSDTFCLTLRLASGSLGVVNYFANGNKAYPKERMEVYSQGRTLVLDNFKELRGYGFKGFKSMKTSQDKGHDEQFKVVSQWLQRGGTPPMTLDESVNVTRATFAAVTSLTEGGKWIRL